jgi:capsular exopolysaccharide synthesis family protein
MVADDHDYAPVASTRARAIPAAERFWQLAKNNKLLIAALLVAGLLIGLLATFLATPQYESSARVEISRVVGNVTEVEGVQTEDAVLDGQYYQTQYELLRARSLAERLVRELNLTQDEQFLTAFDLGDLSGNSEAAIASLLLNRIQITPVGSSNLVDIHFTSPDPALSAKIANAWAEAFIAANLDRRFGATIEARSFLEKRLTELRQRLEDAERELITYSVDADLFTIETPSAGEGGTPAAQTLVASDLQTLNAALAEASTARIAAESALQAGGGALAFENAGAVQPLRQQRSQLAAERARLRATAGEQYPAVAALTAQIAELDQEITSELSRSGGAARAALVSRQREAVDREQRLRARVNELRGQFVDQRRDSVQYTILQREVDTNRSLYNALLQRYREIGVAGVGDNNIAIVDPAQPRNVPTEPNLPRNLLLSLLIGAAVAAGIIFLREQLDQSIRDPAAIYEELGVPLLGSIPRVPSDDIEADLLSKHSELYEAYFSVFTNLSFLTDRGMPKTLMFASARPKEGKSMSSVALANIIASRGKRVLLIDADMRHSGLGSYFSLPKSKGLSDYLSGSDNWSAMIVRGAPFAFDVLPPGRRPPSAAELLSGPRFADLLLALEDRYDHVVVDGPPVLGLADAPLIAATVAGVVLVVEANSGKLRMIAQSVERLERGGAMLFGGLVTKLDQRNVSYGYGYGYGYGYEYGSKDAKKEAEG